jgi:hypothetical protein
MAQNDSEKITYGFDKGSPVGDYSSLAIKKGSRVYLFSGEEADAITAYKDKAVEEARQAVFDELTAPTERGYEPTENIIVQRVYEMKIGFKL